MNLQVLSARSRVIRHASEEVAAWAGHLLGTNFRPPYFALGLLNGHGRLVGAVIFNDFDFRNVEMTMIGGSRAFLKGVCRETFSFAFDELGCERVSLTVRASRIDHINQARRWGWQIEGRKRRYYGDEDAIIMGMLREECRFL